MVGAHGGERVLLYTCTSVVLNEETRRHHIHFAHAVAPSAHAQHTHLAQRALAHAVVGPTHTALTHQPLVHRLPEVLQAAEAGGLVRTKLGLRTPARHLGIVLAKDVLGGLHPALVARQHKRKVLPQRVNVGRRVDGVKNVVAGTRGQYFPQQRRTGCIECARWADQTVVPAHRCSSQQSLFTVHIKKQAARSGSCGFGG